MTVSGTGAPPLPSMSVPPSMASAACCGACAAVSDTASATNNAPCSDLLTFDLRDGESLQDNVAGPKGAMAPADLPGPNGPPGQILWKFLSSSRRVMRSI